MMPRPAELDSVAVRLFLEAIHDRTGYDLRSYTAKPIHLRLMVARGRSGHPSLRALRHALMRDPEVFAHVFEGAAP